MPKKKKNPKSQKETKHGSAQDAAEDSPTKKKKASTNAQPAAEDRLEALESNVATLTQAVEKIVEMANQAPNVKNVLDNAQPLGGGNPNPMPKIDVGAALPQILGIVQEGIKAFASGGGEAKNPVIEGLEADFMKMYAEGLKAYVSSIHTKLALADKVLAQIEKGDIAIKVGSE